MKRKVLYIALILMILLQAGNIIYTFVGVREGYHSDEAWSYGLANSYYRPFLHLPAGLSYQDFSFGVVENINQWIPGRIFNDYVTVQPGERFAYGSVYSNQVLDCHPPLYYMLLHTVCSFFPNQFSWWYGLSLNLLFFVGTQVFLFLTARELSRSGAAAFLACALYGGGQGVLCTFTYMRQYSLLTLLCMAFTYWGVCLYRQYVEASKLRGRTLAAAAVTAFLAFLTHYYAIAYIGIFTALFCLWLLLKRGIKQMFLYGGSILMALLAAFAVFPAAFKHITQKEFVAQKLFPTDTQVRMLVSNMLEFNFGFATSYFETAFWNITIPLVLAIAVAAVLLLLPFRDEPWFPVLIGKIKKFPGRVWHFLHVMNWTPVFIVAGSFSVYLATSLAVDVWRNDVYRLRFICFTFPLLCMLAVVAVYQVVSHIPRVGGWSAGIVCVLVVCAVVRLQVFTPYPYSYKTYGDCGDWSGLLEGKRVLVVYESIGNMHVMMPSFSVYLRNAGECFIAAMNVEQDLGQKVKAGGEDVDYALISVDCFMLEPEKERMALEWMGLEAAQEGAGLEEGPAEEGLPDCTDLIGELAGEDGYQLKAIVTIQGGLFYLIEI